MEAQLAVQTLLQKRLVDIQAKNPHYSLRSFASKLGIHAGALSGILNGKRNVSPKLARRLAERMLLDPQDRTELLSHFPKKAVYGSKNRRNDSVDPNYLQLSASQFRIMAEWQHLGILSLMKTRDFSSDVSWIASRLGLTEAATRTAIDRLIQVGLVTMTPEGFQRSPNRFRTTDDVADISIKKAHEETLDLARESLFKHDVKQRDHSSITMSIDPSKLSMAKELIRKFQDELSDLVESGDQTEVYRLSMHLFPLSQVRSPGEIK